MSEITGTENGYPPPVAIVDEVQDEKVSAALGDLTERLSQAAQNVQAPLPFMGVSIESFDKNDPDVQVEVSLTHENSFVLIQPMHVDGGVRFHILADASIPEIIGVLRQTVDVVASGWEQQQAEISKRSEAYESYFRTRSAQCMHTPTGAGVDVDSCHRCWVETGMPVLHAVEGPYEASNVQHEVPGADEAIALTQDAEPVDEERSIGQVTDLFDQRNHVE